MSPDLKYDYNYCGSNLRKFDYSKQETGDCDVLQITPNVRDFETFLFEHGGHTGNWEEYDHTVFLRCREQHKGKSSFQKEVFELLCGQTLESVYAHEKWYQTYLQKKEQQRNAIKKWKTARELLKEQIKHKAMQPRKIPVKDNERVKHAIEKWKSKVQDQKRILEEKALGELKKLETEKEMKEKYKKELQQRVSAYREAKQALEVQKRAEREERQKLEEERKAATKVPLSVFLKRDSAILAEKEHRRNLLLRTQEERQARIDKIAQQVAVTAERDFERLNKATKAWQERTRSPRRSVEIIRAPFKLQRRSVPEWRRGLTA